MDSNLAAGIHLVGLEQLRPVIERDHAGMVDAVARALVAQAVGAVISPPPTHLVFRRPPGDCHVKAGAFLDDGQGTFVVKVATGFYENPRRGLPTNDGIVLVFERGTGTLRALMADRGWLTSWRTAAAGAATARALAPDKPGAIGLFGTGHQAHLQLDWLRGVTACRQVLVHGRRREAAEQLAKAAQELGFSCRVARTPGELLASARLVVTATASSEPLFPAQDVRPGTHITALGADTPGKQELDPALLGLADRVFADDVGQCLDHGEVGHAVRAGMLSAEAVIPLGLAMTDAGMRPAPDEITVADLTGLAAEDAAAAQHVLSRL